MRCSFFKAGSWGFWGLWWLLPLSASAHIGSPAAVYEGPAGPYSLRVIVLPAPVIPGRAEINVRILQPPDPAHTPFKITVLPVNARAGLKGAPPADEALPVPGEPDLRHAELWLMSPGSYSVHVAIAGPHGEGGTLIVPVVAVAERTLAMSRTLGLPLAFLGALLFIGAVTLVSTGLRDSVRPPDTVAPLTPRQRRMGFVSALAAALVIGAAIYGGKRWWDAVDRDYRHNEIYRAAPMAAKVTTVGSARVLNLNVIRVGSYFTGNRLPLIPDHGKLMHLYMIREPQLDAIAHLHPVRTGGRTFAVTLPPLPAGTYRLYADITHETGFAETLTTKLALAPIEAAQSAPKPGEGGPLTPPIDPDDSYLLPNPPIDRTHLRLTNTAPLHANQDIALTFALESATGTPLAPEPYMGMLGHAAVRRSDGTVFAHIHPTGTISMAAQSFFTAQAQGLPLNPNAHHHPLGPTSAGTPITFPYLFPKPGSYRIWVQTRSAGQVITTPVDVTVQPAS